MPTSKVVALWMLRPARHHQTRPCVHKAMLSEQCLTHPYRVGYSHFSHHCLYTNIQHPHTHIFFPDRGRQHVHKSVTFPSTGLVTCPQKCILGALKTQLLQIGYLQTYILGGLHRLHRPVCTTSNLSVAVRFMMQWLTIYRCNVLRSQQSPDGTTILSLLNLPYTKTANFQHISYKPQLLAPSISPTNNNC